MLATSKAMVVLTAIAIVAGTVALSLRVVAQEAAQDQAVQDQVKEKLQKISDALKLTDDQKAKLKPILQDEVKQMKAVRDDSSLTVEQQRAKLIEIHEKTQPKVNAVLTPEQQEQWKKMKQEAME